MNFVGSNLETGQVDGGVARARVGNRREWGSSECCAGGLPAPAASESSKRAAAETVVDQVNGNVRWWLELAAETAR